jgi:hypothetical protein
MGLFGWLARRALAAWLWAPLVGMWYVILAVAYGVRPGATGAPGGPEQRVLLGAVVLGTITDWLIVRRVKRAMKRRQAPPPQQPR